MKLSCYNWRKHLKVSWKLRLKRWETKKAVDQVVSSITAQMFHKFSVNHP